MSSAVGALPDGVEVIAASSDPGELGALYASSWVGVLPAVEEAFGLVLVESLAAGTPVVADDSGAGPEILAGDERIGRIFAPRRPGGARRGDRRRRSSSPTTRRRRALPSAGRGVRLGGGCCRGGEEVYADVLGRDGCPSVVTPR